MPTNNPKRQVKGNVKLSHAKHNTELESTWKASGEEEHYPSTKWTRSPITENLVMSAARSHLAMARLRLRMRTLGRVIPGPPSHRQTLQDGPHKIIGPTWSETRRKAVSTFKILKDESLRKEWKSHALALNERRQRRALRSLLAHINVRDATERVDKAEEAMLANGETPELWRNTSGLSTVHNANDDVADLEIEKKSPRLRLGHALGRLFCAL
ncbi:MAG: hypothetical protein Q9203_001612 [Teloschistes exilis]